MNRNPRDLTSRVFQTLLLFGVVGACAKGVRYEAGGSDTIATMDSTVPKAVGRNLLVTNASSPPAPEKRFALLIGIEQYPPGTAGLPGPGTDVEEVRSLLVNVYKFPSQNVRTLKNQQATRQAIVDSIQQHLGRAGSDGMALIYFSGHGVQMEKNYSIQDSEATGKDQGLFVWGADNKVSVILDDELGFLLRRLHTPRVVVMVDACYSGSISQLGVTLDGSQPPPPRFYNRSVGELTNEAGADFPAHWISDAAPASAKDADVEGGPFAVLSAADEGQKAYSGTNWPSAGQRHGVFTYYLTRALQSADLTQSIRQVFGGIDTQVKSSTVCTKHHRCQSPQISGNKADEQLLDLLGQR